MKIYVDTAVGIQAVFDKGSGTNYSFTHTLMKYDSKVNDAYDFQPTGPATPVGATNGSAAPKLLASTASLGPVMQEVRLQISAEHKTRVRIWRSKDPAVGGRIELAHRIGVLEPQTEVASRFAVSELHAAEFFSEDNGYEVIRHSSGSEDKDINLNHYPSQMSTFISDGEHQLPVALEHGHGVASLYNGTLDVMQHRRGGPFEGSGSTVVLDDTDRLLTETWLAVGNVSAANRLRHSNKLRLNHPLSVLFGDGVTAARKHLVDPLAGQVPSMGESVHLQSVRATSSSADEVLLNLLHVYGEKELPAHLHQPQNLDLAALLKPFRPDLTALNETSLNGMVPKEEAETERRVWKTASPPRTAARAEQPEAGGALLIRPFEFKTFLAKEF